MDSEDEARVAARGDPADQIRPPVVAVTYGEASVYTVPVDLTLRFVDSGGEVIAERSWSEAWSESDELPGQVVARGGLVQQLPPGQLGLVATLQEAGEAVSCTQPFAAAAGARLILRLQFGAGSGSAADRVCARIETVEDWVQGRSGATGATYVGLTAADAETQARAQGMTIRVVAVDGMDLVVTADLRFDRLDLVLFNGVVVAARLAGEEHTAE